MSMSVDMSTLPTEQEVKQKFIDYFASGKNVIQARKCHQNVLRAHDNFSESLLTHRRVNPTQQMVREWYSEWNSSQASVNSSNRLNDQPSTTQWSEDFQESLLRQIAEMVLHCNRLISSSDRYLGRLIGGSTLLQTERIWTRKEKKVTIFKRQKYINFIPKYKLIKKKDYK